MWQSFNEAFHLFLDKQPPLSLDSLFYYVIQFCFLSIVFIVVKMIIRLLVNKQLAQVSRAYSSTAIKDRKILILGDSTAVGTGALHPEDTIAGRLAYDFPHAQIINLGTNGGLIRDLKKQIAQVENEKFDMVVISAGGNDVWQHSSLRKIDRDLQEVLDKAIAMSGHRVIFLMYSIISSAPLFPFPINFFLKRRGVKVQRLLQEVATKMRIPAIELFLDETNNPFIENPDELFAHDGIHPSSRGYQIWYHRMWLEMTKNGFRLS